MNDLRLILVPFTSVPFASLTYDGQPVDSLYVADASVFPAGCEINPQVTAKAMADLVADRAVA